MYKIIWEAYVMILEEDNVYVVSQLRINTLIDKIVWMIGRVDLIALMKR